MRRALIDFDAHLFSHREQGGFARDLGAMFDALSVYGLAVVGSAPTPLGPEGAEKVRLIVEADIGRADALPAECETEWTIVRPQFVIETHGEQRIVKVSKVEVVGEPRLVLAA
jgi:hypothetical protein